LKQKQGGFFRWLFSLRTSGSWGKISYDQTTISWNSSFLNFGGKFSYPAQELQEISKAKYIDFMIFPRSCYKLTFADGKQYKFTFKLNKEAGDEFLNSFASKKTF